ncbi:helix-turn-helix transcriptional regulator [Halorutilales archaeon Cl-col2-1]
MSHQRSVSDSESDGSRRLGSLSRRNAVFLLTAVVALSLLTTPVSAQTPQTTPDGFDITVFEVDIHESGKATWTIEMRRQLDTEDEIQGFRDLRTQYNLGEVEIFTGIEDSLREVNTVAVNQTGREMSLNDFDRDLLVRETVTGSVGVARLRFNWTGFAATESNGSRVVVGDVFEGGFVVGEGQRLIIRHDEGLTATDVVPPADVSGENSYQWEGQRAFEDGRPRLVLTPNTTSGSSETPSDEDSGISELEVGIGVFLLVVGLFGGVYLGRRMGGNRPSEPTSAVTRNGSGSQTPRQPETEDKSEDEDTEEEVDEELLTDEDRVVRLLRQNDGRMKQASIVEETGWSKSKASMVLSDMEDEGRISKLRLGRENVIDLEEDD